LPVAFILADGAFIASAADQHQSRREEMAIAAYDVSFLKNVYVNENVDIDKSIDVRAFVFGNSAIANATADAIGYNSHSETLTKTTAVEHVGSSSVSESLSATNGSFFHW
jgi:hypothetical protein